MVEYSIIVGLIAVAAMTIIVVFGDNIRRLFGTPAGEIYMSDPVGAKRRQDCEKRNAIIRAFSEECRNLPSID